MARKKKKPTVFMSAQQIIEVESDIKSMKKMLKEDEVRPRPYIQDPGAVLGQIAEKEKLLADHTPKKLTGQASNKAYARVRELKERIKKKMPSARAYYQQYPDGDARHSKEKDFDDAVRQQVEFMTNKQLQADIAEFKHLQRRIDPQDPTISNIELLRK